MFSEDRLLKIIDPTSKISSMQIGFVRKQYLELARECLRLVRFKNLIIYALETDQLDKMVPDIIKNYEENKSDEF